MIGEFALLQLRPAGVIQEMARGQRHVEIAGFPDRFAVVDRLQHRKQSRVTLQHARQGIEMAGTAMAAELCPWQLRRARGADGGLDIGGDALRDPGQRLAGGRLDRRQMLARSGGCEFAGDEMPERRLVPFQPGARLAVRLGRRTIVHGVKVMRDTHDQPTG